MIAVQKFLIDNHSKDDSKTIRESLYKFGIKVSYDPDRLIFTALPKVKNSIKHEFVQECNGLILDRKTFDPLVIPTRTMRNFINANIATKNLNKGLYKIFKARDGTMFNMYWWKSHWCISTARGYDMNGVKWNGQSTYQELIEDCLAQYNTDWKTFTDSLNKKYCYSFGFSHNKCHKFNAAKSSLWFVMRVNLDKNHQYYLYSYENNIFEFETQEKYTAHVNSIRDLYKIAQTSLEKYIKDPTSEGCLGFILRSNDFSQTGFHSDLLIESSLMMAVRRTWYDRSISTLCLARQWDKDTYVTTSVFLNKYSNEDFLTLFPEYKTTFAKYHEILDRLVKIMCDETGKKVGKGDDDQGNKTNNDKEKNKTNKDNDENKDYNTVEKKINETAQFLLNKFKNVKFDLTNKTHEQRQRVLYEFTRNNSNLDYFVELFSIL